MTTHWLTVLLLPRLKGYNELKEMAQRSGAEAVSSSDALREACIRQCTAKSCE